MYVTTASAKVHAQLEEMCGLPDVTDLDHVEIFGPYNVADERKFWIFDPADKLWDVAGDSEGGDYLMDLAWPSDDETLIEIADCLDTLKTMRPPSLPQRTGIKHENAWFTFNGYRFRWIFFPELKRWEIAPLGSN